MTAREFYETVRRMRKAQREYSRTKTSKALQESMELERTVDAEINRVEEILRRRREPGIFS